MDLPTYTPTDAPVPEGEVVIERSSTPQELGPKLNRTAADVVRFLMQLGEMVTATQSLSDEQIELFAEQIGADDPARQPRRGAGGRAPEGPRRRGSPRRTTTRPPSRAHRSSR